MRTLTRFALGVLMIVGTTLTLSAQAAPDVTPQAPVQQAPSAAPQTPPPAAAQQPQPASDATGRFFFNVSVGGQGNDQTFTDTSTFRIYNEGGAVASAHVIGGGTLFDVGVGAKVWENLGIGIGYSRWSNKNDAAVSVRVPHPVVFGQSRTATATAEGLEHSENAVHLQFMWTIPVTNKFEVTAMVGPSFFTVRQTIATVQAPQNIRDVAPFTNVTITSVTLTDVKDSAVGVNIGVDGTYFITTFQRIGVGVGAFARYSAAGLDLDTPPGVTRDDDLKTGGPQVGVGLRLRF